MLVSGLPQLFDILQLQVLEGALLSLFEDYTPEAVNVGTYTAILKLCTYTRVIRFVCCKRLTTYDLLDTSAFLLLLYPLCFTSLPLFPSILPTSASFLPSSFSISISTICLFDSPLVPGESGTAYVKLRDESHVQEFIDVFNGSTVGEDGQDQHTIMLSKYDVMKI